MRLSLVATGAWLHHGRDGTGRFFGGRFDMKCFRNGLGFLLPALVSAVLLGACSGGAGTATIAGPPDAGSGPLRAQGAGAADSTSALRAPPLIPTIYVANLGGDKITAYSPNGKLALTITAGIAGPFGATVDNGGKIYVANTLPHSAGSVTTYTPDGKQTTPTITAGIQFPLDVLVDNSGKIYVSNLNDYNGNGRITTYKPDGTQTTPTITAGIDGPPDWRSIRAARSTSQTSTTVRSRRTIRMGRRRHRRSPQAWTHPAASPSTQAARFTLRILLAALATPDR